MTLLNTADKIMLGNVEVDKIMLGTTEVYAKSSIPATDFGVGVLAGVPTAMDPVDLIANYGSRSSYYSGELVYVTVDLDTAGDVALYTFEPGTLTVRAISETWSAPAGRSSHVLSVPVEIAVGDQLGLWCSNKTAVPMLYIEAENFLYDQSHSAKPTASEELFGTTGQFSNSGTISMMAFGIETEAPANPIERVGQRVGGASSNQSNITITLPSVSGGILEGDIILIRLTMSRGTLGVPTFTCTGYEELYELGGNSSNIASGIVGYYKVAVGGETAATIAASVSGNHQWIAEVYRNAGAPQPVEALYNSNGTGTYLFNEVSALEGSWVLDHLGGRGPSSGQVSPVWAGGAVADWNTASGRVPYLFTAKEEVAADDSSIIHQVSVTNAQGGPSTMRASIVLPQAS